jgi:outer membrane lipase/esterase
MVTAGHDMRGKIKMMKRFAVTGAFSAALSVLATAAAAQQFTNMIVYGDSLSDGGRLFAITGGTQPPTPPYVNGRFSNGPVWAEQLPAKLGFTYSFTTNFAVGGAESGTGGPVGVATQVSALSAATPVNANSLIVVWAGANDLQNRAATTPAPTLIAQTVGNIATAVGTVSARGGKTFLVGNLPDLGRTPGGIASGRGASLSGLTQAYNTSLVGALPGVETARNVRIVVMDIFGLFNDVLANPSTYGFTNTTIPCLGTTGPTGACATAAAAQGTLFFDPIHPSATAHALIANFAAATLDQDANVARVAGVTSYLGPQILDTLRQGTNDRLNVLRLTNDKERSTLPMGVYGAVKYAKGDRDNSANLAGFEYDMLAYTIGFDRVYTDGFVLGGAATYLSGETELDLARGEQEFTAAAFSAYFGYRTGDMWLDVSGAGSWENYDLERNTTFAQRALAVGDTSGNSFYVALDGGVDLMSDDDVSVGPFAGLRYLNSDIDAYAETGAAMFNTSVAEQSNKGVIGSFGLQASGAFSSGGASIAPHLRVSYERELDKLDHTVAVTNGVGQIRTLTGGSGNHDYVLVGAGVSIQAAANLAFTLDYEGTVERSDGKDHALVGRFVYSF